jgi:lysophospholipase L1-like esterase
MRRLALLFAVLLALLGPSGPAQASVPPPTSMAAVGDSITRGFDANAVSCFLRDCPQYSWSTGTSAAVASHYRRIVAVQPAIAGHAYNDARTGAKMAELGTQLSAAASQHVEYVTVLMGANDVCTSSAATMTPTATFTTQFRSALSAYVAASPGSRVFVSSIPNLYQLWKVLHTNPLAQTVWHTFAICQSMLALTNTEAQRQAVLQRETELNNALATVCAEFASCRFDGLATFGLAFTAADVSSVDYFHPSVAGQNKLAGITWSRSYWPAS